MTPSNDEKEKKFNFRNFLLLIGVAGIGFNLYYKYDRYYLGEKLIEKQVIVNDPPEFVNTGIGGTDRYTLSVEGYRCRFWISEGGLSIVRDDENLENKIKAIKSGQAVSLKIRKTDEPDLQNEKARLRIIEISNNQELLIKANDVESKDRVWYRINFGVPIVALITWLILQLRRVLIKKTSAAQTGETEHSI
jgi:hypothetical protein